VPRPSGRALQPGELRSLLVDLLQSPEIRQVVLKIVAVEAIANPGPLTELTGLRAFIRQEVQHHQRMSGDDLPTEAMVGT
jgi:hypothetical protein